MNESHDFSTIRKNALGVTINSDTARDTSYFRYENPGLKELTYRVGTTKIVGTRMSKTGYAFRQSDRYKCFPIPTPYELWCKFDFYFPSDGYGDLRVYAEDSNSSGLRIDNKNFIAVWASEDSSNEIDKIDKPYLSGLHTVILHLKSGKHDGVVEYWLDGEQKFSKSNINVNDGKVISCFYIQTADNYTWISNVIISSDKLTEKNNCKCVLNKYVQPVLTSDGHVGLDQFAVEATNKDGKAITAWKPFSTSDGYFDLPAGGSVVLFSKTPISVSQILLRSSQNYMPKTGKIQWSDYGDNWQDCGEWYSSDLIFATANCYETTAHRYFRLVPTSGCLYNNWTPDFKTINIVATLPTARSLVWTDNDTERNISYSYCKRDSGRYGYNTGVKINDGNIHTIILRSDGAKMQTFIDGELCDIALPVSRAIYKTNGTNLLTLGKKEDGSTYASFDLHELRVYDRDLSDEELAAPPKDDNLKVHYKSFTNDVKIFDMSGNNNDATLENVKLVEVDPRFHLELDYSTSRTIQRAEVLDGDAARFVLDTHTPVTLDCDSSRHVKGSCYINGDTKRKQAVLFKFNYDTSRMLAATTGFDFDTKRTIRNANFLVTISHMDAKRSLMSVPTESYGYATCKEVNLGDVYDIIPTIITEGTTQVEIRTAYETHNYGEWQSYTPQKLTCQYLQVRLKVNGYCRTAKLQIKTPVQEETIAENIEAKSTRIPFTNNYYKVPAIFPAYSGNNLVIESVTKNYCVVHINDDSGRKVAGQVTLLVRG